MKVSESFILGVILGKLGLSFEEAEDIALGRLLLKSDSNKLREYILLDSNKKNTLLRTIYSTGIDMSGLNDILNLKEEEYDNPRYWINSVNFREKISVKTRRTLIDYLLSKELSLNAIAAILGVAVSTVQNDRNSIK